MSSKTIHTLEEMEMRIMGRLDSIDAALDNINTQLGQLSEQIGVLVAGEVTQEEIDALAAKAQSIADAVDSALEVEGEDGAEEPGPEEETAPAEETEPEPEA